MGRGGGRGEGWGEEVLIGAGAVERERGGRMLEDRPQQGDELLVKWLLFSSRASWILLFLGFGFKVRQFRQFPQIRQSLHKH